MASILMRSFVAFVTTLSVGILIYVYAFPPPGMRVTRDGVPHFAPKVINPETKEPVDLNRLSRHYQGK